MNKSKQLMADAKFYSDYARYNDDHERYETWSESVERVMDMHKHFYRNKMSESLLELMELVSIGYKDKLFLGAQRALQFGGDQLLKHHLRLYNCASTHCDRPRVFAETMYTLLCGAGVGFSVQKHHIERLPELVSKNRKTKTFKIPDSIEGWAESIDVLIGSYLKGYNKYEGYNINFDYSEIRSKGSFISGGFKAPGYEPLRDCLDRIDLLLSNELSNGHNKIRPIVAYDIMMYVADAVISGGVRRSATICMFSKDDEEMIKAKTGSWFIDNPQRGRSNNSVILKRDECAREEFDAIIDSVKHSGEPGFIFVDDLEFTLNPCVEVGMLPISPKGESGFQVCNLTEINGSRSTSKEIFFEQCKLASILGTLQAGYTDFKFLTQATKDIVDREALIGVGITGFMNNPYILFNQEILEEGAEIVKYWNKITADLIGINQAARTTVVKPSGNASVLLGTASGIHGEHSKRYFRHVQFNNESEIARLFNDKNSVMCEKSVWSADRDTVVAFPITSDKKSIFKSDLLGVKQLEYVKHVQNTWISAGKNLELCTHPKLSHNVSNTITVDDWDEVGKYIYDNKDYLCGVSMLAASGDKAYPQAPFTEVFTHEEIIEKYGQVSLFTSALIETGLQAFNQDLWNAISTALGYGEKLEDKHENILKLDFVKRFNKFSKYFTSNEECGNCLKDVYNLHKWWKIENNMDMIKFSEVLFEKTFTDIDTTGAQACAGGKCEI